MHATKQMGPIEKLIVLICAIAIAILWWKGCTAHAQENNPRTTVVCGGGPDEFSIIFVPPDGAGAKRATCPAGQAETWYENLGTPRYTYYTTGGLFAIKILFANGKPGPVFGPVKRGGHDQKLEVHLGDSATAEPQLILIPAKPEAKPTILHARQQAEVNADLKAGRVSK